MPTKMNCIFFLNRHFTEGVCIPNSYSAYHFAPQTFVNFQNLFCTIMRLTARVNVFITSFEAPNARRELPFRTSKVYWKLDQSRGATVHLKEALSTLSVHTPRATFPSQASWCVNFIQQTITWITTLGQFHSLDPQELPSERHRWR